MEKRTQESEKRKSEQLIIEAILKSNPWKREQAKLKFTELLKKTNMGKTTLNRALTRMMKPEEKKITRVVENSVGKPVEIYYVLGPRALEVLDMPLKFIVPTREHYEALAEKFNEKLSAKQYLEEIQHALGKTLLSPLLESLEKQRPISADPILKDFKFLITKWIAYRRNPTVVEDNVVESTGINPKDVRRIFGSTGVKGILRVFQDLEEHPGNYKEEMKELKEAAAELD